MHQTGSNSNLISMSASDKAMMEQIQVDQLSTDDMSNVLPRRSTRIRGPPKSLSLGDFVGPWQGPSNVNKRGLRDVDSEDSSIECDCDLGTTQFRWTVEMQASPEQSPKQHQTPNAWNTPTRVLTDVEQWPKLTTVSPLVANKMMLSNKFGSLSADQRKEVMGSKQRESDKPVRACRNEDSVDLHMEDGSEGLDTLAISVEQVFRGSRFTHNDSSTLENTVESSFSWDAKVVIALAAFSMNYSRLWLVLGSNPLASSLIQLTQLTQLPDMIKRTNSLKLKFEAMTNLIKVMLDVTKCIVDFKELPSQYIALNPPEMVAATASISIAVYWTLRSIVACALQIQYFIGMRLVYALLAHVVLLLLHLHPTSVPIQNHVHVPINHGEKSKKFNGTEFKRWQQKMLFYLTTLNLARFLHEEAPTLKEGESDRQVVAAVDAWKHSGSVCGLVNVFQTTQIDNLKILKSLIYAKDDQLPLVDGSTKRRVSIDVLRRKKNVLLLISNLDFSHEEHFIVVWVPIVDITTPWDEVEQRKFKSIQASMPWFSVHHPALLDPTAIKYIKEVWFFNKKPLLVDKDGKYICLYGGENLDWIRRFTNRTRVVAEAAGIPLEMMYVGKNNPRKKVWKISSVILAEKLSHILPDPTLIWFFWVRLESLWHSKMQNDKTIDNDPIMNEIMTILSFDGSDDGWAVMSGQE
ncbi:unnamed protein product [Camellia sinensis]